MTEPQSIDEVILAIQGDPPKIVKKKTGQAGPQKTRYADLVEAHAVVMPRLTAMQTIWKCKPTRLLDVEGAPFVLRYELRHLPSGTSESGDFPLKLSENPQQMGSAITYARRYALMAVLGLVAEDEDDDGGGGGPSVAQRSTRSRSTADRPASTRATPTEAPPVSSPADGEPHRGRGGLITHPEMTRKLAIVMNEVIGNDSSLHKQFIADMIGREVKTRKDLTFDEGRGLIDAFEKAKQDENPAAVVIDIYRRTTGEPPTQTARSRTQRPAETRSVQQQTRDAVLGQPAGPDDEPPPWEESPADSWPEAATPGGQR